MMSKGSGRRPETGDKEQVSHNWSEFEANRGKGPCTECELYQCTCPQNNSSKEQDTTEKKQCQY